MRLPRLFCKFQELFSDKRGCVFPMVIWPAFRMGQFRVNDHPYHAPSYFSDHPFKRALLGSAVGLVVLLIILFGVWCIRRRELKRKKHLAILVSIFNRSLYGINYSTQKRVGTYSARVHNGNINGLLSTWKVLMEKKIYLLVSVIFMFFK